MGRCQGRDGLGGHDMADRMGLESWDGVLGRELA